VLVVVDARGYGPIVSFALCIHSKSKLEHLGRVEKVLLKLSCFQDKFENNLIRHMADRVARHLDASIYAQHVLQTRVKTMSVVGLVCV
jgi:hypothetical protein